METSAGKERGQGFASAEGHHRRKNHRRKANSLVPNRLFSTAIALPPTIQLSSTYISVIVEDPKMYTLFAIPLSLFIFTTRSVLQASTFDYYGTI